MELILFQGMACLGKTTLCKRIEKDIDRCKHFSLDSYKEKLWDINGFSCEKQRQELSYTAKTLFYKDIYNAVVSKEYNYILLDYVFVNNYWAELSVYISKFGIPVKTIYMIPDNLDEHKKVWENRSRDFTTRHPGHGASIYHKDTGGSGYTNTYESKIFLNMKTAGTTMKITVSFNPYRMDADYNSIIQFIKEK